MTSWIIRVVVMWGEFLVIFLTRKPSISSTLSCLVSTPCSIICSYCATEIR